MTFSDLQLSDYILEALTKLSYKTPSAIQQEAIPHILEGKDVLAQAQTGTGKTASFALPILQELNNDPNRKKKKTSVHALILVPTRELAIQVSAAFKRYNEFGPKGLKSVSLIGGEDIKTQITSLRHGADIVVATPGRLLDLVEQGEVRLVELKYFVIDEADKMLNLGFAEELDNILEALPKVTQNMLFSATFPPKVLALTGKVLNDPIEIRIDEGKPTVERISQKAIQVDSDNRRQLLQSIIKKDDLKNVLVFVASKRAAHNLASKLSREGIDAVAFHGDLEQEDRTFVLRQFHNRNIDVLVATDIATRGIDFSRLSLVVNYDLPRSPSDYVHRIGRTGRAGAKGEAISFIGCEDEAHFQLIEKRAKITLEREQVEGFEMVGEVVSKKGGAPVKGKRKSKKDKLREAAARKKQMGLDSE